MKCDQLLKLIALASVSGALVSCDFLHGPLDDSDAYNPLDVPEEAEPIQEEETYGPRYSPGTFLVTTSSNTAFYDEFPKRPDQSAKSLPLSTDVKVISTKGSYVKVEVVNTGEVGYVPSVVLREKTTHNTVPATSSAGSSPVIPGMTPVPELPPEVPTVAPDPEIPGIGPPELVDPSRPAE